LALAAVVAAPVTAGASVTFGADLSNTPTQAPFIYAFAPVIDPGGLPNTGAPISGVLVSVRVKTTGPAGTGAIRILTQTSHPDATTYGFLNTPPEISIPFTADATAAGHITQLLTRRPITAGQKLGWYVNDSTNTIKSNYNDPTAECSYTGASHPVGAMVDYSTAGCNNNIVLESGTIEADADATTQAACPVVPRTPVKKCKKKKGKSKQAAASKKKCKKKK
jgi:hypothetical protein